MYHSLIMNFLYWSLAGSSHRDVFLTHEASITLDRALGRGSLWPSEGVRLAPRFENLIQKPPTHRSASQNQILNGHRFTDMTSQRYRGGRQSKGDRQALISRVASPLGEAVRDRAEAHGMSVNDYIASVLAREVGMAELAPQSPALPRYEELPISEVA